MFHSLKSMAAGWRRRQDHCRPPDKQNAGHPSQGQQWLTTHGWCRCLCQRHSLTLSRCNNSKSHQITRQAVAHSLNGTAVGCARAPPLPPPACRSSRTTAPASVVGAWQVKFWHTNAVGV